MERAHRLVIIFTLILFAIPFFWLKPGEMDLGGDNSRLYFYHPLAYLTNHTLYSVSPSGFGSEVVGFWALPFISLLIVLKNILLSSTFVISAIHGLSLAMGFLSCYLIVKELCVENDGRDRNTLMLELAAITSGLFYILGPSLIYGWDKVIMTHSQIFLNPLMFYLLLKYFRSSNFLYILTALFVTLFFSQNFSFAAIAPFLAFYPLSILFLVLYTKIVLKKKIVWQHLLVGIILFLTIQAFHLIPHIINTFSPGSSNFQAAFTPEGQLVRGLSYFVSIAKRIKVSLYLMNLPQLTPLELAHWFYILFPLLSIAALLWNKRKGFLLSFLFFVVSLYLATANITQVGVAFYKALFYIPGFSMFRNYFGQWQYVYLFSFTILFGQAFYIILTKLNKSLSYLLTFLLVCLLAVGAWPLLGGSQVNKILYQSDDVKIPMVMDPMYQATLDYISSLPINGRLLTLPLADPGYQIVAGLNGGAYQGPSTIAYVAGKNDFSGYDDFGPFNETVLTLTREKKYDQLKQLFGLLNIKYVFHNSDTRIYDDTFPRFPYTHVRSSMPEDQAAYKNFLGDIGVDKINSISDKYSIYEFKDDYYLPRIYPTAEAVFTNNDFVLPWILPITKEPRITIFTIRDFIARTKNSKNQEVNHEFKPLDRVDGIVVTAENRSPFKHLIDNPHLHIHEPLVSQNLDSIIYPLVLLRERFELSRKRTSPDDYIDLSLLQSSKRIFELAKEGESLPILYAEWEKPNVLGMFEPNKYKSWEANFANYKQQVQILITWVENSAMPQDWKIATQVKINEQLLSHKKKILEFIKNMRTDLKTSDDKTYLAKETKAMFDQLFDELALKQLSSDYIPFSINIPSQLQGEYELYVRKDEIESSFGQSIYVNDKRLEPLESQSNSDFIQFHNVYLSNTNDSNILFKAVLKNHFDTKPWQPDGKLEEEGGGERGKISAIGGSIRMTFYNTLRSNFGGFTKEITDWKPKSQYLISFAYKTDGNDFAFKFFERRKVKIYDEKKHKNNMSTSIYLVSEKNLNAKEWTNFQMLLTANSDSEKAFMKIIDNSEDTNSTVDVKDLSVLEIPYPMIFFKKVLPDNKYTNTIPRITFQQINPTKYKLQVRGVKSPYYLTFLEGYNSKWKLYLDKSDNAYTETIQDRFVYMIGNTLRRSLGALFSRMNESSKEEAIVGSYFNGEVSEKKYRNTFLEPITFETWGKSAIADDRHYKVNIYANAWYIVPDDVPGKIDYTLILEMSSQKYFYAALIISFLGIVFMLLILLFLLRK